MLQDPNVERYVEQVMKPVLKQINELKDEVGELKQALHKTDVSGSPSFKEQLINELIPRIEEMKEKERKHLHWLIDNDAPMDFIQLSQKYYKHFTQRIKEYQEYAERL